MLPDGGVLLVVDVALVRGVEADEVKAELQELVADRRQAALQQHRVLPIVVRRHLRACERVLFCGSGREGRGGRGREDRGGISIINVRAEANHTHILMYFKRPTVR